jgi:hypothetical protein
LKFKINNNSNGGGGGGGGGGNGGGCGGGGTIGGALRDVVNQGVLYFLNITQFYLRLHQTVKLPIFTNLYSNVLPNSPKSENVLGKCGYKIM